MSMNRANRSFLLATPINRSHFHCYALNARAQTTDLQSLSMEMCARGGVCALKSSSCKIGHVIIAFPARQKSRALYLYWRDTIILYILSL